MESRQIFSVFGGNEGGPALATLCRDLLARQKGSWVQLRQGYEALKAAAIRRVPCSGYTLNVQWNPQRIVSSAARVDPDSLRARPCFLCRENLPDAQRAILYRKEYLVLCNPAPIFRQHYTISHIDHRPQSIEPALTAFLSLMKDLSPHFTVLYNGPKSGASAPDHQHFQAAPAGALPVEADIRTGGRLLLQKEMNGVDIFEAAGMGRAILVLKGAKPDRVTSALLRVIAAMRTVLGADGEPMMNLTGFYKGGHWTVLIFPRRKHRPHVFDLDGEAQILITPASVEMGGLFITPVEKDFRALDARLVDTIFRDVSVDEKAMAWLVAAL